MANLLTGNNATFATGLGDWIEVTGNANFTTTHNAADGGVLSAAVTTGGSNVAVASHPNSDPVKIPVTAGDEVAVSAKTKQLTGSVRNWQVDLVCYDAAGTNHANALAATGNTTVGSYVTLSGNVTIPASTVRCRVRVRWTAPAAGETFYLDDPVIDDVVGGGGGGGGGTGNIRRSVLSGGSWVDLRSDVIT